LMRRRGCRGKEGRVEAEGIPE
jgi:hypothetical protein